MNVENLEHVIEPLKNTLGGNLGSILLYGSSIKDIEKANDIDLIILIKEKRDVLDDVRAVREIMGDSLKYIDAQLLYENEIINENVFSLDTHGAFFVEELKTAVALVGENPFKDMLVSSDVVQASVLQKLQYYIFRARQECLGYFISTKDKSVDFHRKKIFLAMKDILIAKQKYVSTSKDVMSDFIAAYPGVLQSTYEERLKIPTPLKGEEALPIYEDLYGVALYWAKNIFSPIQKPLKEKWGDIVFEYILPDESNYSSAVILCDGLPSIPCQNELMSALARRGHAVLFPRYRGTWESSGIFLEHSPVNDIIFLIHCIKEGRKAGAHMLKSEKISIISSSFGGAVALSLAKTAGINSLIALSPVLDFKKLPGLDSLKRYLQTFHAGSYRFEEEGWNNLINGSLIPPPDVPSTSSKIYILGGEKDDEIKAEDLLLFGGKYAITTSIYPQTGHLSFSKVRGALLDDIVHFI